MIHRLVFLVGLFLFSGCTALPALNPTPIIIVVTATPETTRGPVVTFFTATPLNTVSPALRTPTPHIAQGPDGGTPDVSASPAVTDTPTLNLKATTVQYVLAKEDINIRKGPGTTFDIVGGVYAGQTAQVTGYMSADEQWWRVVCPVDNVTDCWVSADPSLTEPTTTPNVGPTPTVTTEVGMEAFVRSLASAIENKNYDAMAQVMGDPFPIGYWRSEGTSPTRAQALTQLKNWIGPASNIVVDVANKTDQTQLLDGTNPLSMWDPNIKVVKTVYVTGLADRGEALLVLAQRFDSSLYWYGMLYAGGGGFAALNQ